LANPPKGKAKAKPAATKKPAPRSGKATTSRAKSKPADLDQKYVVSGNVTYADLTPVVGLTVIAFDKDVYGEDYLGQPVVTTESGAFAIHYTEADFRRTKQERGGADVIVCVYNAEKELLFTSKKKNNAPANYELNIKLPPQPFVVRGTVTDANHKPLANLIVRAHERDLRIPQLIGTDKTTTNGEYRIEYHLADFKLGEVPARRTPWLIVEVLEGPEGKVLAKQEVQKASHDQTVLFTLTNVGVVSEKQRIDETVTPLLKGQGTPAEAPRSRAKNGNEKADLHPADLTGADVDFIVLETGLDRAAVQAWATSSRMLRDALLQFTDEYPAQKAALHENGWAFFFGIARQGQATDLDAVLRESAESLNQALKAAVSAHRIPPLNEKQGEILLAVLKLLQGLQQLDPAGSGNSDFARVLASLSTPLPNVVALDALTIVQEKGLDDVDALLELTKRHPDAAAPIKNFVRGVRVHQLTSGHEVFSRLLNVRLEGGSDSIAPLAAMPSAEWMRIASEASISPGLALQTQALVERQHPMTALSAKMSTGNFELPGVSGDELAALTREKPALVESILKGSKRIKDTVEGKKVPAAHKVLRDMGRYLRTGVSMELGAQLMKGGITSPGLALRYGEDYIHDQIREMISKEIAREVAADLIEVVTHANNGGNALWARINTSGLYLASQFEEVPLPLPDSVRENLPTLPGLFGDLDECICRPCESMLGQPAYLVDLLNQLGESLRAKLKLKRPGIFTLQLSCENADTNNPMQHIDIVLEVLEDAAAPTASASATKDEIEQIAHKNLAKAIFPWSLPFDYGFAQLRAYLGPFDLARTSLQLLRTDTTQEQLAAEGLGLTFAQTASPGAQSEWQLLTEQRAGEALWAAYGFDTSTGISLVDPASRVKLENQTIKDVLTRVSVLIDRTGLELEELEQAFKTEFVSGYQAGLTFTNRHQCKTSEMRLSLDGEEGEEVLLKGYLDRLHRFTRLRAKLPGWSIPQLNKAIAVCGGLENGQITAEVLIKLATLKRLHEDHSIPLEHLFDLPASTERLRKTLGLSALQFSLLKEITALNLTVHLFTWAALEELCNAAKRIRESGLSVEQVAQAMLTRDQLKSDELFGELLPVIKTDKQIEELLKAIQERLRDVVTIRPDQTLESQAIEALSEVYDAATAAKLIKALGEAGAATPIVLGSVFLSELKDKLSVTTNPIRSLGEWLPLLTPDEATRILAVSAANLSADDRFTILLQAIAHRRRERELIAVMAEQCGLTESEVIPLMGARLQFDASTEAATKFLNGAFWDDIPNTTPPQVPSVTATAIRELHAWMDRLYRLISLGTALKIDGEFMHLADHILVDTRKGIDWRDILAAVPATGSAWSNPNWQALLDMLWLQQPDRLSRPTLIALSTRLADLTKRGIQTVSVDAIRPLATRLEISEAQTLAIAAQATTVTTDNLRDPRKLRPVFELLLLAKHLGASDTQLDQLANLANNTQAATTAKALMEVQRSEQEYKDVWQVINNKLRQQRRDALVAYLIHRNKLRNANDLYEHYLIDPQMEPCFETTRVLEAITATQLFAQRVLFGLEKGVVSSKELKDRWTWMRNYRVWEANRKVFLFPENWLFPELRDEKSSSFKQLESALGQGELNQDLANQAFGQFLDDVAQMGQVEVLGMYEDISRDSNGIIQGTTQADGKKVPDRRTLYVVGRTQNPPYAYFWRYCLDFGSTYMEWSPWQRIELDIQGDHVLPFVLSGQLHIAWPVFKRTERGSDTDPKWEVRFAWSRFNGNAWNRQEISRDPWSGAAAPFRNEQNGFSLRCDVDTNATVVTFTGYVATPPPNSTVVPDRPSGPGTYKQVASNGEWYDPFANRFYNYPKAGLRVYWNCWIQLRNASGQTGFIKLEPASAYPDVLLRQSGWTAVGLSSYHLSSGTGPIPPASFSVEGSIRGISLPRTPVQTVPEIPLGDFTTVMLHFTVDATKLDAKALGFELDVPLKFEPKLNFQINRFGQGNFLEGLPQNPLPVPELMNPWMNGYREALHGGFSYWPFSLRDSTNNVDRRIFELSSNEFYWALSSASNRSHLHTSGAWYFRESGTGVYIDLALAEPQSPNGFRLYADGYPESAQYRSTWVTEGGLNNLDLQNAKYGSIELPIPGRALVPDTWIPAQAGDMAFDARLPYACYNWEVFFHAPLLIADQLSKQHKFEDAERWLRYVFDPTSIKGGNNAKRFLQFRVFKELNLNQQVIDDLTALAQAASGLATDPDVTVAVGKLINRWRDLPFRPFLIARHRHIAFLWRTLFAYLDNLIAWADSLYRRDTIESINEATMLYVLAERILGRRPKLHKGSSNREALSYDTMAAKLDEFANYWIDVVTASNSNRPTKRVLKDKHRKKQPSPDGMLHFCMPFNDKIMSYWSTIDARLSNVRNCRNIEGIERKLPLMDAEIDPELLIRATAAGLDLQEVIAGLYAPPPHYRYSILSARAAELANEAKSLGAAMLSAIEKHDAEHLAKLRSSNEINLLKLVSEVRKLQITETERNIEALRGSRRSIESRYNQYQRLLGIKDANAPEEGKSAGEVSMLGGVDLTSNRSSWGLIKEEDQQYVGMQGANTWSIAAGIAKTIGGGLHATAGILAAYKIADETTNASKIMNFGGQASTALGDAFSTVSQGWRGYAEEQGMMAGHIRRRDEWAFQSNQTLKEMQQIDKQILANQIRIDITNKELNNHIEQIEQSKAVDEVMRSKFSNEQLYEWMKTELSKLYFSAYRMALDMARKAERAVARELGVKPLNILGNAYWDSLRDGLLAGERLHQDLKRLEITYLDQNRREYELTKHISLRRLDPKALVDLRAKDSTGRYRCEFDIPEWLFDLDTPGHYLRRIKSVSVSIPSVTGPYTSVNCKLTLLKSQVRHKHSLKESSRYLRVDEPDDDRFTDYFGASEAIVTSTGTGDSGLFETNLRDERFLPFEGSGVISEWRLELPDTYPQFDYSTISDVVLSIRYTAREGGDPLRAAATSSISTLFIPTPPPPATPLRFPVLFSCRSDFPTEWSRARAGERLKIKISSDFFPYWVTAVTPKLSVQKVESFNLIKGSTSSPTWAEVWPTPASGNNYTANQYGYGEADFPTVGSDDVTDRIVLVSVGRQ